MTLINTTFHKNLILVFLLLLCQHGLAQKKWAASWIATDSATSSLPNSWHCFRYSFQLDNVPRRAISRIAVDTKYWLYVNNKLVVYEGGLKRGPTPQDTFFDEVDLSSYLKKGTNTISVLVWYWGLGGLSHNSSGKAGLIFDCQAENLSILSSDKWKALVHPGYEPSRPPKANFRLSEPSIFFNASKDIPNWNTIDFDDRSWPLAAVIGKVPCKPWNDLVQRPIPFFKDYGIKKYVKVQKKGDTLECSLPYNAQVTPRLKVRSLSGKKIVIQSDTYYMGAFEETDSLYTLRSEYITRNGDQEYESLGWLSGHKIIYIIPNGVQVLELSYRETGYNAESTGSFKCDDPFLNKLWTKSHRTTYLCMRDNYMDCTDRERAQWGGDGAAEMHQSFYALDTNSFSLARKFYHDLIGWQDSIGKICVPVPWNEPRYKLELPAHSLMPIGEYGGWVYFKHSRDTSTIKIIYDGMRKYLALWKQNENGSLEYRPGGWDWGDWGNNQDRMLIQHGWYLLAMQAAQKMASVLNFPEQEKEYERKIKLMTLYLNSPECWDGKQYRYHKYTEATDDRVNALFVLSGVADSSKWNNITAVLSSQFHSSPWMEKFVIESLFKMNKAEYALQRMKQRYRTMVDSEYSTLWEMWKVEPGKGYNHGWAGGPLTLLSQFIGGISPDEKKPSFYNIIPFPAKLKEAETVVNVREGILSSSWQNTKEKFTTTANIPQGAKALIGIPKKDVPYRKIFCNGKLFWLNGKNQPNQGNLKIAGENPTHYLIDLGSGKWKIAAEL